jgi:hypothetical protein
MHASEFPAIYKEIQTPLKRRKEGNQRERDARQMRALLNVHMYTCTCTEEGKRQM